MAKKTNTLPAVPILVIITLLFLPLFLDVFSLELGFRRPSNNIRYLTGLMFEYALSVFLYPAFIRLCSDEKHGKASISSFGKLYVPLVLIGIGFFLKYWDMIASYIILQALAFWGFLSLFAGFIFTVFGMLKKSQRCKKIVI